MILSQRNAGLVPLTQLRNRPAIQSANGEAWRTSPFGTTEDNALPARR